MRGAADSTISITAAYLDKPQEAMRSSHPALLDSLAGWILWASSISKPSEAQVCLVIHNAAHCTVSQARRPRPLPKSTSLFITLPPTPSDNPNAVSLCALLLLRPQHGLADIIPRQPYIRRLLQLEDGVHGREVGARALERRHVLDVDVGLARQVLLRHGAALLVLEVVARLGEGLGDVLGHLLRRDGPVGAVDLGQALAFGVVGCLGWDVAGQLPGVIVQVEGEASRTFAVENFFSVPTTAPLLCAAFNALLPLIVVSRSEAPGPRTLLPILVTLFQSLSPILLVV